MFISQQLQTWWQCETADDMWQIYTEIMHSEIVTCMNSGGGFSSSGGGGGGGSSDGGGGDGSFLYY